MNLLIDVDTVDRTGDISFPTLEYSKYTSALLSSLDGVRITVKTLLII